MNGFAFNPRNSEASGWNSGWETQPSSERESGGNTGTNVNALSNPTGDSCSSQCPQSGSGFSPQSFNWSQFFSLASGSSQSRSNLFNSGNLFGASAPSQFAQQPALPQWSSSPSQGKPATQKANTPVNTALVEVGAQPNGQVDDHAQAVDDVYKRQYGNGAGHTDFYSFDDNPDTSKSDPKTLSDKKALDTVVDNSGQYTLNTMSGKIDSVVKGGKDKVISASLGYSRDDIYSKIITLLKPDTPPDVLQSMGLTQDDIKAMPLQNGRIMVSDKVAKGVMNYVDNRLDAQGSPHQNALAKYQQSAQNAANHGVMVVVAAGNSHEMNVHKNALPQAKPGADTNFLAQSDKVLVAAASDDKKTPNDPKDDTIAPFSSYGTGRYNPTVAVNGVEVPTNQGPQDGTSFSAPQLAATTARMLETNPNLTFGQTKADLQNSAYDTQAPPEAEGAGIMNGDRAIQEAGSTGTARTA